MLDDDEEPPPPSPSSAAADVVVEGILLLVGPYFVSSCNLLADKTFKVDDALASGLCSCQDELKTIGTVGRQAFSFPKFAVQVRLAIMNNLGMSPFVQPTFVESP